jgi:hypothetical protein
LCLGKEVSLFAECKFEEALVTRQEYREGRYGDALREAFHRIDELLELQVLNFIKDFNFCYFVNFRKMKNFLKLAKKYLIQVRTLLCHVQILLQIN